MAIWNWARGLVGQGAGQRRPGLQSGESGSFPTAPAANVNQNTALCLSAVWASVRLIAESVASMPLRFYTETDDGNKSFIPNGDYQLARILNRKPNQWQTRNEFFETLISQKALLGNGYCLKIKNGRGDIVGLLPMMSEQMEVTLSDDDKRIRYKYNNGRGIREYSQDDIWHLKLFGNGIMGLSPLSFGRNAIGIGLATENRVSKIMANGAKPSGVLKTGEILKPDQKETVRQNFRELAEGNNDTLFVLEGGFEYQQISMSPKDIELIASRRFQIEDIARFFGVPSVMINDTSATTAWGSGIEQIVQGFYKLGLRPYLERIEASINYNLIPEADRGRIKCEFDFNALLRADMAARLKTYKEAITGGFMTPNEARALEGWSDKDGGDDLYMQQQMVPVRMLANGEGINAGAMINDNQTVT